MSKNSAGNTFTIGAGYSITGNVLGQGSDTFQLGGDGSADFDLTSIGPSAQYRGFTAFNVVGGVWSTTGTFDNLRPETWNVRGGTLAGASTFGTGANAVSIDVASGGTLEPGVHQTPGGIMTINGNLTLENGSNFLINLSPSANSEAIVSGTVTIDNSTLELFLTPGTYGSKTYTIIDPPTVIGQFSDIVVLNYPGFSPTALYNGSSVVLGLKSDLGGGQSLPINQHDAATGINTSFNSGNALPASFLPIFALTGTPLVNALSRVDGEDATGAERGAFYLTDQFLELMLDPFVDGRSGAGWLGGGGGGGGGGTALGFAPDQGASLPPDAALAYAGVLKAPSPWALDRRWTAWAAGFGGSGTSNGDPVVVGSTNVTASDYGYAAGADYHYSPDTVFGFALAGGGTNWSLSAGLGGGRSDTFEGGVYGVSRFGPAYVAGALSFGNYWLNTDRFAFGGDHLTASFQGQSYGARGEVGYRFAVPPPSLPSPASGGGLGWGSMGITPYAALQAQSFHTPGYSETDVTGGGFGLSYASQSSTDTRSELGARWDQALVLNNMPLTLRSRLAWAHDWVDTPSLTAAFQGLPGSGFVVYGAAIPHDSALSSTEAVLHMTSSWSLSLKFDSEIGNGTNLYAGSGTLRYRW